MILDTNALSSFLQDDLDLLTILAPHLELYLPVVVLGEYRFGLLESRVRHEAEGKLAELEHLCVVLNLDSRTARPYAEIRRELRKAGHPIPENDIWIAALARQHRLPIVSRDEHFDVVAGIRRVSW